MDLPFELPLPLARPGIALVPFHEAIRGGSRAAGYIGLLKRLREDARVKVVILDIDSPGGEVTASDSLYLAARKLRDRKPVVAFVRGVGASGSYLLACAASRIVAQPSALIGSIGVISVRPLAPELLDRLGVRFSVLKTGPYKDSGAFYRLPTEEEDARQRALIEEFYEHFIGVIAEERKLDLAEVRRIANGEVFWATKGKTLGLVDELGDLETAVDAAATLGRVPAKYFTVRPLRPLPQRLLGAAASALIEEVSLRVEGATGRILF